MSETDFAREATERAERDRFELEKIRARHGLALALARRQLIELLRQRAFRLALQSDAIGLAILASRIRRSRRGVE